MNESASGSQNVIAASLPRRRLNGLPPVSLSVNGHYSLLNGHIPRYILSRLGRVYETGVTANYIATSELLHISPRATASFRTMSFDTRTRELSQQRTSKGVLRSRIIGDIELSDAITKMSGRLR